MKKIHSIEDVAFDIAGFAVQAMLYEASAYPSPGLVSAISSGAHKDMNYYTFLDSTTALMKPLILCAQAGMSEDAADTILKKIRGIGIEAEKAMFKKTKGVNTHKGILFLLGIACAASANVIFKSGEFSDIKMKVIEMTKGIVNKELHSLSQTQELSNGEKLFLKYGTEGIRGEVEKGIPTVFEYSLELYEKNTELEQRERLIHTLLGIMEYCEDSTILHRHSVLVLKEVQERARGILKLGGMKSHRGKRAIEKLDLEFSKRGISPGGSADLLACTVFLNLVKEYIEKNIIICECGKSTFEEGKLDSNICSI